MNTFKIKAIILDSSPLELLIVRSTIKKYGLVRQIPSQFKDIVKPEYDLIANYDKSQKMMRTPETTAAFHEMKL